MTSSFMLFMCILSASVFANVFPGEAWHSGRVDLGNGGDKMFYIRYKACNKKPNAPLILYMAGGPGTSGEFNILIENGPYVATYDEKRHPKSIIEKNPYSWNKEYDLLYIDQPVGVGFSVYKNTSTVCRSRSCVVSNVYKFLVRLYEMYPEYKGRPFYTSGVSYAGHYVPGVSAYIIKQNNPRIL